MEYTCTCIEGTVYWTSREPGTESSIPKQLTHKKKRHIHVYTMYMVYMYKYTH